MHPTQGIGGPLNMTVENLLTAFAGSGAITGIKGGVSAADVKGIGVNNDAVTSFLNRTPASDQPKAYLNWILFDEQMNYVDGRAEPVKAGGGFTAHEQFLNNPVAVTSNGYLYVFASNESNLPVYFDNLTITHTPGVILEESHYYPMGMEIAALSSRALRDPYALNKEKYQGQEYEGALGLNMYEFEARQYDAQLGRWHVPDPMNQFASPYSALGNNWPNGIDPDGRWFIIDDFVYGFVKGTVNSIFGRHEGNHRTVLGDAFASGLRNASNSAQIWGGLFTTNPNNNFFGRTWELISRFTWQLPQTSLGFIFSHSMNMLGDVQDVDYFDGATVLEGNHRGLFWGLGGPGMTVGNYIMGRQGIDADENNTLFAHEYGHYLQSRASGPIFLTKYGIPSLFSRAETHNEHRVEQDANARTLEYFQRNYAATFNINNFVIDNPIIGYNRLNPINDPVNQMALRRARLRPRWFDYIPGFMGTGDQAIFYSILFRNQQP